MMNIEDSPVIVGGVGGSGTRVIAELLSNFGYYIGNDLNRSMDNLLYTFLFKRVEWFYNNYNNKYKIKRGINLFDNIMKGNLDIGRRERMGRGELYFLVGAYLGSEYNYKWKTKRIYKILENFSADKKKFKGWGFKEPNSHLLIDKFRSFMDKPKYIHVIRNGLDMAFSKNKKQLYNWGDLFEVNTFLNKERVPSFEYWKKANSRAINLGENLYSKDFLLVKFEDICSKPKKEGEKIANFLGLDIDKNDLSKCTEFIYTPESIGRHKSHDLKWLDKKDTDFLKEVGYKSP